MTAGAAYAIVLDGYNGNFGKYQIDITAEQVRLSLQAVCMSGCMSLSRLSACHPLCLSTCVSVCLPASQSAIASLGKKKKKKKFFFSKTQPANNTDHVCQY